MFGQFLKSATLGVAGLALLTGQAFSAVVNVSVQFDISTSFTPFGSVLQTAGQTIPAISVAPGDTLVTTFIFVGVRGLIYVDPTGLSSENFEIIFTGGGFPGVAGQNTLTITDFSGDLDDPTEGPDNIGFVGDIRQAVFGDFTDTLFALLGGTMSTNIGHTLPGGPTGPFTYDTVFLRASPQDDGAVFAQTPIGGSLPYLVAALAGMSLWRMRSRDSNH